MGRACDFSHAIDLDMVFIFDSSISSSLTNENYELVKNSLADSIIDVFPDYDTHLGFTLFAEKSEIQIELTKFNSPSTFAEMLREEERLLGSQRNMKDALNHVFDNAWTINDNLNSGKT